MQTALAPQYLAHDGHSPCEHFAAVGYDLLLARADQSLAPDEAEQEDDRESLQRWEWRCVLGELLRDFEPRKKQAKKESADSPKDEAVPLAGVYLDWHRTLPRLKTWAGRMTLAGIIEARLTALHGARGTLTGNPLDWQLACGGTSGVDPRVNVSPLAVGFSPDAVGIDVCCFAVAELLAFIGLQVAPITRFSRDEYGYQIDDEWWSFAVTLRPGNDYLRMLQMSRRM